MSEPQQPATPPPPPPTGEPKKKGFGALGWIAIGCIGIILLGGLLTFACTAILAKKAKDIVEEASDNPAMSAAEMVVRMNPDFEIVEKDEEAGILTIYDKQKDRTLKLSLDQVMQGKFGVQTDEGETMNFELGAQDDGSFGATVTDEAGETSKISIGGEGVRVGQKTDELPSWLPGYKDVEISSPFSMSSGGKVGGTATFSTADSVEEVAGTMTLDLEGRGFEVETARYEAAGVTSIILTCKGPDGQELTVSVNARGGRTGVAMNFSGSS